MSRYAAIVMSIFALFGCAEPLTPIAPDVRDSNAPEMLLAKTNAANSCSITLCLTGAMSHDTPSNIHFRNLCANNRIPGLVRDCTDGHCNDTFDSFLQFPLLTVYPALIDALDRTGDGHIDEDDPVCEVNLIGFSWGGVNAVSISRHLGRDHRVPESHRRIARLVLLDAYQPISSSRMGVPDTVDQVLSIRHSAAPEHDCSRYSPLGPYLGFAPICGVSSECHDYDYSQSPDELFEGYDGGALYGDDVGHCDVPYMAESAVVRFLNDEPFEDSLPPEL